LTTGSFPHDNSSSVYWIFTKLDHMIPLWKGKNPIYFGVVVKKYIYSNGDIDLWPNDPKINRVLPLPQGKHVAKFGKDPIYRTKFMRKRPCCQQLYFDQGSNTRSTTLEETMLTIIPLMRFLYARLETGRIRFSTKWTSSPSSHRKLTCSLHGIADCWVGVKQQSITHSKFKSHPKFICKTMSI
jgi:hypothetical protein